VAREARRQKLTDHYQMLNPQTTGACLDSNFDRQRASPLHVIKIEVGCLAMSPALPHNWLGASD
jgi:hypothetical protein